MPRIDARPFSCAIAVLAIPAAAFLAPAPSMATDGVIEISQQIALAGGVNGDLVADPPGFPIRITQPGSYRLTGPLAVADSSTVIRIDVRDVEIDLGGFTISGPNVCSGSPVSTCTLSATNAGIESVAVLEGGISQFTVVKNGFIVGMAGSCISLRSGFSEVDHVRVRNCGGHGIAMGVGRVVDSFSGSNGRSGILAWQSVVERNAVSSNHDAGILMSQAFTVPASSSTTGRVSDNRVFDNNGTGIFIDAGSRVLVRGNVMSGNSPTSLSGGSSAGNNLCNTAFC